MSSSGDRMAPDRDRRLSLSSVYGEYHDPAHATRWSSSNPGNVAIAEELERTIDGLVELWASERRSVRLLDLGCGGAPSRIGHVLVDCATEGLRIGEDLLLERLMSVPADQRVVPVLCGDGTSLPHADDSVDVVVAFTLFSSVLERDVRHRIGAEIGRVMRPGGILVWYDMRFPSLRNANVSAIRRVELRSLFPDYEATLCSITVAPPIARRLGRSTRLVYPLLAKVPFLRSHTLGMLRKPA